MAASPDLSSMRSGCMPEPLQTAQALYNYEAVEDDELSFARGDKMILYSSPEEGWYECELKGQIGLVPANYVRLIFPEQQLRLAQTSGYLQNSPQPFSAAGRLSAELYGQGSSRNGTPLLGPSLATPKLGPRWSSNDVLTENDKVLNEESGVKNVHERLYEEGIILIKKQQVKQEMSKQAEGMQTKNVKPHLNQKSMQLASRRKPDKGRNYGEFLYQEGQLKKYQKAEYMNMLKREEEAKEDIENTFTPRISQSSKTLRRDMPVVERLLMLEQIKQERLERLKRTREQEESRELIFSPRITDYEVKEEKKTELYGKDAQRQRDFQKHLLQEKLKRDLGLTHTPRLCERSRRIARRSEGEEVWERLHKDAERREMKFSNMTRSPTSQIPGLDLAGIEKHMKEGGRRSNRDVSDLSCGSQSSRGVVIRDASFTSQQSAACHSLYEKAEKRRTMLQELERQRDEEEQSLRRHSKITPKSEELSAHRKKKDYMSAIERFGFVTNLNNESAVNFLSFSRGFHRVFEHSNSRVYLFVCSNQSLREKTLKQVWAEVLQMSKVTKEKDPEMLTVPLEIFTETLVSCRENHCIESLENEDKKNVLRILSDMARIIFLDRLSSNKPSHQIRSERAGFEKRLKQLQLEAAQEFRKIVRELGGKLNDSECDLLFEYYDQENRTLRLTDFVLNSSGILTSRKIAMERWLKRYDINNMGAISIIQLGLHDSISLATKKRIQIFDGVIDRIQEVNMRLQSIKEKFRHTFEEELQEGLSSPPAAKANSEGYHPFSKAREKNQPRESPRDQRNVPRGLDGSLNQIPRHEILHQLSRKKFEKMFAARQKQDEKEMEHCTFRPVVNPTRSHTRKSNSDTTSVEDRLFYGSSHKKKCENTKTWEERELELCTFRPTLVSKSPKVSGNKDSSVKPREDASKRHVDRVRRGEEPEANITAKSLSPPSQEARPPMLLTEIRKNFVNPPLFCLDVDLGNGKMQRLEVHKGDDVAHLVGSFCRHYNLDDKCCQNLQALIDEQLVCIDLHGYTSPSETSVLESDDSSI